MPRGRTMTASNKANTDDRPRGFPAPILLPLAAIPVGLLLDLVLPPVPGGTVRIVLGVALAACGLVLIASAVTTMFRRGATPIPNSPEPVLIIAGPYKITRNPIYLGDLVGLTGIALIFGSLGMLVLVPLIGVLIQMFVIRAEEAYLERRFGRSYAGYRQRVRRWL